VNGPRFRLLSEHELERVHGAALELLQDPGARIMTEEARTLLLEAGAALEGDDVIRISSRMVEQALETAPYQFTLHDRTGAERLHLGEGHTYFGSGVTALAYLDPATDTPHDFTLDDVADAARLTDALPNLDFVTTPGVVRPSAELPLELVNQHEFLAMVTNTTKPLMVLIANGDSLADVFDMAEAVAGGREEHRRRPFVVPYLNSVSPLLFNPETLDKLLISADRGVPVVCQAAPQVGATGPVTVAGTIAIAAAETLCGLVLAQLRRPGTPYISGVVPFVMDMRRGNVTNGASVGLRFMVAMGELSRHWGLPLVGTSMGGDSKTADEQAALEVAYYGLGAALAGVDLVFDAGNIEGGLLFSPEVAVMADESVGLVRGAVEPLEVSDETLALDTIRSVGPSGTFLGEPHTLTHFRELWTPRLLSWEMRQEWEVAGATTMRQRARERVSSILSEHRAEPLPGETVAAMSEVIEARRRSLVPG
jgi:trimethylamine--corrinoid protein Co-methyltransferase